MCSLIVLKRSTYGSFSAYSAKYASFSSSFKPSGANASYLPFLRIDSVMFDQVSKLFNSSVYGKANSSANFIFLVSSSTSKRPFGAIVVAEKILAS